MDKVNPKLIIREAYRTILPAQILAALIPFLSGIINGLVIGNFYSNNMISVIGFTTPVTYLLSSIRTLFGVGGGATAGNFMGQGELSKVNETFRLCIKTLIVVGVTLMFSIMVFTNGIAGWICTDQKLTGETANYLRGLSIGFIPSMLIPFLSAYLQLAGASKRVVISSILNAAMNLSFDLIAVIGFNSGVMGIGVATSIAQWLSVVYLYISIRRTGFVSFSMEHADIKILGNVFRYGINSCMLVAMESVRNSLIVKKSLTYGGLSGSSAISVLFSASGLVDFITSGFMSASIMIGSLYAGEENEEALHMSARSGMIAGEVAGLISGGLFFILAKPIALAFGADEQSIVLSIAAIRIYAVYIMLVNPLQIILRIYQSLKRIKITFVLMFIREIVISISAIFILGHAFGARGVWMSFPVAAFLGSIIVLVLSAYMSKKQGRKKLDILWYKEAVNFTDRENYYITDKNHLREALQGIDDFCDRNELGKKSQLVCRHLAEENIVTLLHHGRAVKRNNLMISVFIGTGEDKTRIVFQDNSPQFDPLKRFGINRSKKDAIIKDASINIIKTLATDISYQFSFGMNIMMIDLAKEM